MKIFYIMGKSASGKDYMKQRLIASLRSLGFFILPEYTTRTKRDNDSEDPSPDFPSILIPACVTKDMICREHIFTPNAVFKSLEDKQFFAETRSYTMIDRETDEPIEVYYGTPNVKTEMTKCMMENESMLLIGSGTPESFLKLRSVYTESELIGIYLKVSDKERLARAINRECRNKNPKYDEVCRRYLKEQEENFWYTVSIMPGVMTIDNSTEYAWTEVAGFILLESANEFNRDQFKEALKQMRRIEQTKSMEEY